VQTLDEGYMHVQESVTEEAAWAEAGQSLASHPRTLGLATCAAVLHVGALLDLLLERWHRTWDVNVLGTVLAMRAGLFERHLASAEDPGQFPATRDARQPMGEILDPGQVADAIILMLSKRSAA
jgi:hypothetical protein